MTTRQQHTRVQLVIGFWASLALVVFAVKQVWPW